MLHAAYNMGIGLETRIASTYTHIELKKILTCERFSLGRDPLRAKSRKFLSCSQAINSSGSVAISFTPLTQDSCFPTPAREELSAEMNESSK
jgi:hypothetical protein